MENKVWSIKKSIKFITEKGAVVPAVRKALMKVVDSRKESMITQATRISEGKYELPVINENGETLYIRFEVKVSNNSFNDLSQPKSKPSNEEVINFIEE